LHMTDRVRFAFGSSSNFSARSKKSVPLVAWKSEGNTSVDRFHCDSLANCSHKRASLHATQM